MRGRSSKTGSKGEMEVEKIHKLKEEPHHMSGAYIRNLVKQLTSSRSSGRDPLNPNQPHPDDSFDGHAGFSSQNPTATQKTLQLQQPQHHRKQVRRRLHTSRPYQERLLNMAEARREIVTALKFHRAAMKQANEQQQQPPQPPPPEQQQPQLLQSLPCPSFEKEAKMKSRRNSRIYPSSIISTPNFPKYIDNNSYSSFCYLPPPPPPPTSNLFGCPVAPPPIAENLNLTLPDQTLGLNLNFQDFNGVNTCSPFCTSDINHEIETSMPSSSFATNEFEVPSQQAVVVSQEVPPTTPTVSGGTLHPAMGDHEMAEIISIGEQHEMEWNDTLNLVTSAWWFKFLNTMELGPEVSREDEDRHPLTHEFMEFPTWLNTNETWLQQHFSDDYSDISHDPALPCMDIGEIEGVDEEWFA